MADPIPSLTDDPCGRAQALRGLRDRIITGTSAIEVEFRAGPNGVHRRVRLASADLAHIDLEIKTADAACGGAETPRRRTFYPATSKGVF